MSVLAPAAVSTARRAATVWLARAPPPLPLRARAPVAGPPASHRHGRARGRPPPRRARPSTAPRRARALRAVAARPRVAVSRGG